MPVMIFKIPQVVNLVLPESSGATGAILSNYPMNRTDFKLIRTVQNEIEFFVRNIDRKPVALAMGEYLTLNIVDLAADNKLLLSRNLTVTDASRALFRVAIAASETVDWNLGTLRYSICLNRADGKTVMLWTDRDYSPYGFFKVEDGPILESAESQVLDPSTFTPDSGILTGPIDLTTVVSSSLVGSAQLDYRDGTHTIAAYLTNFTGKITVQASLLAQPNTNADWFTAIEESYGTPGTGETGTFSLNTQGNYMWVRILISAIVNGTVDQILYKN